MPNPATQTVQRQWFKSHNLKWLALAVLTVILDQITKKFALHSLQFEGNSVAVLPFFNWTLAYNPGAAFSFLSTAGGWQRYFFSLLALIMSCVFVLWLMRMPRLRILPAAIALILGGALGNLIDRMTTQLTNYRGDLVHGVVIDFIHVHYGSWHFPIFNLADCAITLGTMLLLIDTLFLEKHRRKPSAKI